MCIHVYSYQKGSKTLTSVLQMLEDNIAQLVSLAWHNYRYLLQKLWNRGVHPFLVHQIRCDSEIAALAMSDRNFLHSLAWGLLRFFSFSQPLRSRNPLLPAWIGTIWTLKEDCSMTCTGSRYLSAFRSRASSKFDSKHTLSSKSSTSCFESFHITKSGRRSVVAM